MDIKNLPSEVTKKTTTVKDYVPTVSQYRDMFNCGNVLDRTIISMALDLAWRIGDFVKIRKDMLPNLAQETPIPFDLITEKEEVVCKSFLSAQTVQLLRTYLKTLPKENAYLFHNGNGSHYDPEAIYISPNTLFELFVILASFSSSPFVMVDNKLLDIFLECYIKSFKDRVSTENYIR